MPAPLTPGARSRLRQAIVERLLPRFDNSQLRAAEALGVDQSTLSRLITGPGGGSQPLAESVANFLNEDPSLILQGTESRRATRQLRELPEFQEAMAEALRRAEREHPGVTRAALERAADCRVTPEPYQVTAPLLIQIALNTMPPPQTQADRKKRRG